MAEQGKEGERLIDPEASFESNVRLVMKLLGMPRGMAEEFVAIETGESDGDVVELGPDEE